MILSSNYFELKYKDGAHYIWAYTRKNIFLTIASGATPIGSAGRAPDDVYSWILEQGRWRKIRWNVITPIRSELFIKSWLYNPNIFSQIRLRHAILELRYRNETRMPWFITKVRPQDPSCEAWYTHMDALCWYVSVSTTRRKSWWTHWVPWEPLGFILCKS
jgi:hypothetical protein